MLLAPSARRMPLTENLDTHQKALHINLDATSFGSFAEIGAGQEVVRWFMLVGGASGTVAKSISAYDKEVSDDLYGSGSRYVSRERLDAMLDHEWAQLLNQLQQTRSSRTRFFAFCDTIAARNYSGTNAPHGWVGIRFQTAPGGPPNDILLHINLRDPSNVQEQEAVGILGVNLIYAAFNQLQTKESLLDGVAQDLDKRIEIDYVDLRGPAFESWDRHALLVYLVCAGLAEAVCFPAKRSPVPPAELIYKKTVVLAPGRFQHLDPAHAEIHQRLMASAIQQLRDESAENKSAPAGFFCLSASSPTDADPSPTIPELLTRIHALLANGGDVLLFHGRELYTMTDLVNRYTQEHVRFVVGLSLMIRVFEDRYSKFGSRFLEVLSRLFAQNVRIYAFPMTSKDLREAIRDIDVTGWQWTETNGWISADQIQVAPPVGHLYSYLLASKFLVPMQIPATRTAAQ